MGYDRNCGETQETLYEEPVELLSLRMCETRRSPAWGIRHWIALHRLAFRPVTTRTPRGWGFAFPPAVRPSVGISTGKTGRNLCPHGAYMNANGTELLAATRASAITDRA